MAAPGIIILFFIGALIAAFGMLIAYAIDEHSKHDLKYWIKSLWVLVGVGGAICGWQVFLALDQSAKLMELMNSARMVG